jgi:hypothetical protein
VINATTAWCFDLDSTLRDSRQRHHLSPVHDPSKTWHDYSVAGVDDTPIDGPIAVMKALHHYHQIHIVSGSNESALNETALWLRRHVGSGWDFVKLRADGDTTQNGAYKVAYVRKLRAQGIAVAGFFEDWWPAAQDLRAEGVPVVVVNPGYPCAECGLEPGETARVQQVDNIGGGL